MCVSPSHHLCIKIARAPIIPSDARARFTADTILYIPCLVYLMHTCVVGVYNGDCVSILLMGRDFLFFFPIHLIKNKSIVWHKRSLMSYKQLIDDDGITIIYIFFLHYYIFGYNARCHWGITASQVVYNIYIYIWWWLTLNAQERIYATTHTQREKINFLTGAQGYIPPPPLRVGHFAIQLARAKDWVLLQRVALRRGLLECCAYRYIGPLSLSLLYG